MQDILQQVVLTLMLVSMMFAMGLRLTVRDLAAVLQDRRLVGLTVVVNFVALPLLALVIVKLTRMDPDVAAGFLLCSAAPGATMTTILSRNANADVPVAVALLLILVVISALVTPPIASQLFIWAGLGSGQMRAGAAVLSLLAIQVMPLGAGMLLRSRKPLFAAAVEPVAAKVATLVLVVVIVAMSIVNFGLVVSIGGISTVFIAGFIAFSTFVGWSFSGPPTTRAASAFATGAQNIALATLLAERYLNAQGLMTVLIFGLITYLVLLPLVAVFRKRLAVVA